LVILDDHSHFVWTFHLHVKSDTFPTLSKKFVFVSMQFDRTIKAVQCDNGHEFDNAPSHAFFVSSGVVLQMSYPYTSPQNDKVEHSLHTINNIIHSLLFQASMPARYWVEGIHTTMYLLNHLPCKTISISYPYATLYGIASSYEHLRVFGCVYYPNLFAQATHKLAPGPLIVSSLDTPLTTKVIGVSIPPPTTLSSPDMSSLMRQPFPLLPHPV
jgi:hypothetical protein